MKKNIALLVILVILAAISAVVYLGKTPELGFPLDDAWIHQVYARNLGTHGTMSFVANQPSSGSTAPAWSLLLALGYVFKVPPTYWAYFCGSLFAVMSAWLAALINEQYFGWSLRSVLVGVLCLLEWHLAWAALSGMEITLFIFVSLLFFYLLNRDTHSVWMGLLTGLAFLVRPEAFLLVGVYGLSLIIRNRNQWKSNFWKLAAFLFMAVLVVSPVMIFNLRYGGRPFPNTIAAKYIFFGYPWTLAKSINYLVEVARYFLIGPYLLLFPFFIYMLYRVLRKDDPQLVYPFVWIGAFIGMYSITVPVLYHHGRYIMPLIPWIAIIGMEGLNRAVAKFQNLRIFWPVYQIALVAMVAVLWIDQSSTYALQVDLLRENHMKDAQWVMANTDPDAVIATNDIGIIGYMTDRKIVDLQGLVTPDVIPLLLDQRKLAEYTIENNVSYYIVFTEKYQELLQIAHTELVYSPDPARLKVYNLDPFEIHQVIQ